MKRLKYFLIPCFLLLFIICLVFPASAEINYKFTFKELLTYGDSYFSAYRRASNGQTYYSNYEWSTDNYLNVNTTGSSSPANIAYGLRIFSAVPGSDGDLPIFSIERNEVFLFENDLITFAYNKNPTDVVGYGDFRLDIKFLYSLSNGTTREVLVASKYPDYLTDDGRTAYCEFTNISYFFEIPQSYVGVTEISFEVITGYPSSAGGTVSIGSHDFTLYIGDRAGAPIYNGPNDSNQNALDQQEEQLRNNADEGYNKFSGLFSSFEDLFSPTSDFFVGATFITALLNRFITGIPGLNSLLILSLTLGLLLFIVGSVGFIGYSINSNRVRSEERVERREYRRAIIDANRAKRDYFRRK